jgi:glutamate/tyrosine decarboxylase-like PLP-dependent enzyme
MSPKKQNTKKLEVTLDPDDWDKTRSLGHLMLDDMMTYLQTIETKPTRFPTKKTIKNICTPLSEDGEGEEKVYEIFKKDILPYTVPITRPRMWAMVAGTGSPYGMLAEMLRAGTNSGVEMLFSEAYVHQQVIDWIKSLLGFPMEAGGVLVSGGSEANFTALAVARNAKAEVDVKSKGVQSLRKRMTIYCGDETHHCMERSVELLGLGNEALRWVSTDDQCRVKLDALKEMIKEDREAGYYPFCIARAR